MNDIVHDCELYAKIIEGIVVVEDNWKPGDSERSEPRETLLRAAGEILWLRKAIQDYLDGNWGTRLPSKNDTCPHGKFGWEECVDCIYEYFAGVLNPPAEGKSL